MNGDDGVDRVETNLSRRRRHLDAQDRERPRPLRPHQRRARSTSASARAEYFELNSLGGDDTLTTHAVGLPITVARHDADGGAATTRSTSATARHVPRDASTSGGAGTDKAIVDAASTPSRPTSRASTGRRSQPAPAPAAGAGDARQDRQGQEGRRDAQAHLPGRHRGCNGSVALFTTKRSRPASSRPRCCSAARRYTLKAGETKTIKVKLASGTAKLAKHKKLAVSARAFSQGADERTSKVTLASNAALM